MTRRDRAIAAAGALIIRLLGCTWRTRQIRRERFQTPRADSPQLIFVFWHGRLLPLSWSYRNHDIQVLASQHRDGQLLARVIHHLGFGTVAGSSTRGGTRAIRELVDVLGAGYDVGITVDGPRGPRHVVKPGCVRVASLSGATIVPVSTGSRRHRTFASWDRFELPYPFTRVCIGFGEPVQVPPGADPDALEAKRREVEEQLHLVTEEVDREVGSG